MANIHFCVVCSRYATQRTMIIFPRVPIRFFPAVTLGASNSRTKLDFACIEFSNGGTVVPADVAEQTLHSHFDSL